jgi:pyruvate dehydrogenase E1 component alpha subunit
MTATNERVLHDPDVIRALNEGGDVSPAHDPALTDAEVRSLYRWMLLIRQVDSRLAALQQQGRVGFHVGSLGEEATVVGSIFALGPSDWVFPTCREAGAALMRGVPLQRYVDNVFGNSGDICKGRQLPDHPSFRAARIASVSTAAGASIPHAVGLAWAARSRGDGLRSMVFFGEGAADSAEFHNGLNFAGVFRTPTIFLCRNSGWVSSADPAAQTVADKGVAYGIESIRCDGNDLLAVITATRRALEHIRAGHGPVLLECLTQRQREPAAAADPVARVRRYLEKRGQWDAGQQAAAEAEHEQAITAAVAQAERSAPPPLESLFDDVYATPPWHLTEQRSQLMSAPRARRSGARLGRPPAALALRPRGRPGDRPALTAGKARSTQLAQPPGSFPAETPPLPPSPHPHQTPRRPPWRR